MYKPQPVIGDEILNEVIRFFEYNQSYLNQKGFGFKIDKESKSFNKKKFLYVEIEFESTFSEVKVYNTGECDFSILSSYDSDDSLRYFKNVVISDKKQLKWEFENFFVNFSSLKGSSIDPLHDTDSITDNYKV